MKSFLNFFLNKNMKIKILEYWRYKKIYNGYDFSLINFLSIELQSWIIIKNKRSFVILFLRILSVLLPDAFQPEWQFVKLHCQNCLMRIHIYRCLNIQHRYAPDLMACDLEEWEVYICTENSVQCSWWWVENCM